MTGLDLPSDAQSIRGVCLSWSCDVDRAVCYVRRDGVYLDLRQHIDGCWTEAMHISAFTCHGSI